MCLHVYSSLLNKQTSLDILLVVFVVAFFVMIPFATITAYSPSLLESSINPDPAVTNSNSTSPTCSPSSLCPFLVDNAYGFNVLFSSGISGAGQTIVVIDACGDPTLSSDLGTFDFQLGLPNPPLLNITDIGGKPCTDTGWSVETSLDVEWAHVASPSARIEVVIAAIPNPRDIYGSWTYALNHHLGNQISNSFGGAGCYNGACDEKIGQGVGSCESIRGTQGVNVAKILELAKDDNVTVLAGSGDSGATGLGTTQVEAIPADCQGVLTVGGTTLWVSPSGGYVGETAWYGSSGGGYMTNREPSYQANVGIVDPFHTLGKPDVAAVADPNTGVEVYNNGTWQVIGGTSVACPLWAGFIADVNEIRAEKGLQPVGFVNQFLYETVYGVNGSSSLYVEDFHDITAGNNTWTAGPGWNSDTGLGAFIVPSLAETLGTNPLA
jgi:subtilase family serine protease